MSSGGRLATRTLLACLAAACAGCGSGSAGEPRLTIYVSAPLSGPRAEEGRDVADGARLALADAGGEAAGVRIALAVRDDADAGGWQAEASGANAREASEDSTAIAYLGEIDSGASRTSIPITNGASILQVSPAAAAEDLTRESPGSTGVPAATQPSGARTFGRIIPSDIVQGQAAGEWMARQGVASVAVVGGGSDFGAALTAGLESATPAPAIVGAEGDADAIYVAGERLEGRASGSAARGIPLFGSDALLEARPPAGTRLTSAALDPSQLPPAADGFLVAFRERYGRPPGRLAAYGYEAMAVTLDAIERAEDPLDRGAVVDAFFATDDRKSILGTYSIDPAGETTLRALGAYQVRGGRFVPERRPLLAR